MKRKKLVSMIAIVLIAGSVGAWAIYHALSGQKSNVIPVSGNIELTQVDIAFKMAGRLTERAVDEGQKVSKGMVVARLDADQLRQQQDRERAAVASADTQVAQVRTALEYQRRVLEADTELRGAELRQARARLADLLAGSRRQEIEQAQAAVDEAASEEQRSSGDWQRAQTLYKNDDISTSQYDQFHARYKAAAAAARQARERLALVKEGPRPQEIEQARAQVARAEAALKLSEASRLEVKRRGEEIETREAEAQRARAQLGVTNVQLGDTVAVSPIEGVVLSKAAEVGQIVAAGTTVLTIGDIDHPWVRAYIPERDKGRVKLGARARITTDAYPGKVYEGRVSYIASEAEFTPKQIQTPEERVKLVYRIKIEVPNPRHELDSNMPVDAQVLLDQQARN